MANDALVSVFKDKDLAGLILKELLDKGFDAAMFGPVDSVTANENFSTTGFTSQGAGPYYVVTASNKT
jgi:hypothetical protein